MMFGHLKGPMDIRVVMKALDSVLSAAPTSRTAFELRSVGVASSPLRRTLASRRSIVCDPLSVRSMRRSDLAHNNRYGCTIPVFVAQQRKPPQLAGSGGRGLGGLCHAASRTPTQLRLNVEIVNNNASPISLTRCNDTFCFLTYCSYLTQKHRFIFFQCDVI